MRVRHFRGIPARRSRYSILAFRHISIAPGVRMLKRSQPGVIASRLRAAAKKEKIRRYPEEAAASNARNATRLSTGKKLADYARDLANATNIDQVIAIKEELPADFEPGLRNYISTREAELGPR